MVRMAEGALNVLGATGSFNTEEYGPNNSNISSSSVRTMAPTKCNNEPHGVNMGQGVVKKCFREKAGDKITNKKKDGVRWTWWFRLYHGSIGFVRYCMDAVMVANIFSYPEEAWVDVEDESLRSSWSGILNKLSENAKKTMDYSLKRAERYRIVSILAKARAGRLVNSEGNPPKDYAELMSFPVIRRSGRKNTGGVIKSYQIAWQPRYYWRGMAVSSPEAVEDAVELLRMSEAKAIRKNDLEGVLPWYPLVVDADEDEEGMIDPETNWYDVAMYAQVPAADVDYELPPDRNAAGLTLRGLLEEHSDDDDLDTGEVMELARAAIVGQQGDEEE